MEFSIHRLGQLIRREFLINARVFSLLIISLFIIAALIMLSSTEEYCNPNNPINIIDVLIIAIIQLSGYILSASIFTEFRNPASRGQYLSLPASHLEKWFSKWLICVPIHLIVSTLILIVTYKIAGTALHSLWPECSFKSLIPFDNKYLVFSFKIYFIFQSLCFFFGLIYNKHAWIKTLASGAILLILFSAIITISIRIIFGYDPNHEINLNTSSLVNLSYVITPLLWLASYFKLKEKEL